MGRRLAAIAVLWLAAAGAYGGQAAPEGFFATRDGLIRLYGNASAANVTPMYERATETYERTPTQRLLYERAVLAELAKLRGIEAILLVEIIEKGGADGRLVTFAVEEIRSHGGLVEHAKSLAAAAGRLQGQERFEAVRALAQGFLWASPPREVEELVRREMPKVADARQAAWLAGALASWGYRDEAGKALVERAVRGDVDVETRAVLAAVLDGFGMRQEARGIAKETFAALELGAPPADTSLDDVLVARADSFAPYIELAKAADASDLLLDRVRPSVGRQEDWRYIDYAIVLKETGLLAERAEALSALAGAGKTPAAAAAYGAALQSAGDAWSAEKVITASVLSGGAAGENAFLDLIDSIFALRDAAALCPMAVLYSVSEDSPQASRMMSELLRRTGDIAASDELFNKFILASNMGPESRFNCEGSRLLAQYYLDTGRLEMGRATAMTALRQAVDGQAGKSMTRSRHPEAFVTLFDRFDGVEAMLDYLRTRRKDFPGSVFLSLMEEAALIRLGRVEEAIAASERAHPRESAVGGKVLLGEVYAAMGRYDEAAKHYEMALAADSNPPSKAYLTLAGYYAKAGSMQDAERLLSEAAGRAGLPMWFVTAGFFASEGDTARATRAYRLLDDLEADVDAESLGEAVRFLAGHGQVEAAATMLARRLSVQESYGAKGDYIVRSMPRESSSAAAYLALGAKMAEGDLIYDHALLALFYRELSERAGILLDAATAVAAASAAVEHDGENAENLSRLVAATAGRPSAAAARAALAAYAKAPSVAALLSLAEAELSLGRTESGCGRLSAAASLAMTSGEAMRAMSLAMRYNVQRFVLDKFASASEQAWPWQAHAFLAEVAFAAGGEPVAVSQAKLVAEGGSYPGRALWAADFYFVAGAPQRASDVTAAWKSRGEHPALALLDVEAARRRGDSSAAREAASAGCRAYPRPPLQYLFSAELGYLKAKE